MPEEYLSSASVFAGLVVGSPPFGTIIEYGVPLALGSGDPIAMTVLVKNTGDLSGSFYVDLWDADTGDRLWQSTRLDIGPGEEVGFYVIEAEAPTMPNRDLELIVQTHHDGEIDESQQKRVPLLVQITTALSINLEPSTVDVGGVYTHSGKLIREDTDAGLAGERISLRRDGVEVAGVTTDGNGNYSSDITAPTTPRSYACHSVFLGSIELGLGPSSASSILETTPLPPEIPPEIPDWWPWIVGGIFAVIGLGVASPVIVEEAKKKGWIK